MLFRSEWKQSVGGVVCKNGLAQNLMSFFWLYGSVLLAVLTVTQYIVVVVVAAEGLIVSSLRRCTVCSLSL